LFTVFDATTIAALHVGFVGPHAVSPKPRSMPAPPLDSTLPTMRTSSSASDGLGALLPAGGTAGL
jgi:hypothetical protein